MNHHTRWIKPLAVSVALTCAAQSAYATELGRKLDTHQNFSIPAQPLSSALLKFSKQTGIQIMSASVDVSHLTSATVSGEKGAQQALTDLLNNTGLKFHLVSENAVSIEPIKQKTARNDQIALLQELPKKQQNNQQPGENNKSSSSTASGVDEATTLDQVVVTGTRIRGVNPTKPVQVYDRQAIEESGSGTIEQFIHMLPQDFRGGTNGASPDGILGSGASALTNNEAASGVNLRGLGNEATLTLLNGRRIAPSTFGNYVDISMIPLGAIERVEIITDGASAIYGADAVGGVVNIVTRDSYDGAETQLSYGGVTSGSKRDITVAQTLGKSWDGGNILAGAQYRDSSALPSTDRSFTKDTAQPTDIAGSTSDISAYLSLKQNIGSRFDIFADGLYSDKSLFRHIAQSATTYDTADVDSKLLSVNFGAGFKPFSDWRFELSGNYSSHEMVRRSPVRQPLPTGYVEGDVGLINTMDVWSIDFQGDGALFETPGGTARAALGATYREEKLDSLIPYQPLSSSSRRRTPSRDVKAVFGELYVPIIGNANQKWFARRLDLSAAIRYDEYSDFGGTTNPQIGLLWSPANGLDIRASWGTSFRAPNMNELINQGIIKSLIVYPFASPTGGVAPVFLLTGVDSGLGPEDAETWTAGFDYYFSFLEGASFSLNYYDIHYKNRIVTPPFATDALLRPEFYGTLITPLEDNAAAAAYLGAAIAEGKDYYDLVGSGPDGVRYVVNLQQTNAAFVNQSGFDATARYGFDLGSNHFDLAANATIIKEIVTALTPTSTPDDIRNRVGEPLSTRLRATVGWSRGPWTINAALNHRNGYTDTTLLPYGNADPWTTFDVTVGWTADFLRNTLLHGAQINFSVINVFDEDPPHVSDAGAFSSSIHYDAANADPYGRQILITIRKAW